MSMVYYVLEIIMANLLLYCVYLEVIYIYIYYPHSVSMRGEPVSGGTSALLHFFTRTKMIQYLCTKYKTNLSLIFNISIVHCTQTNQSIVNYFEDQRYQSFKSKNVDSKYEQNVSCMVKGDEKIICQYLFPNIQGKWYIKTKERSTKMLLWKEKRQLQKVKSKKEGKISINHRKAVRWHC